MKALYFTSFYFRVFNSIREIRENKNLAKISTYTVLLNFCLSEGFSKVVHASEKEIFHRRTSRVLINIKVCSLSKYKTFYHTMLIQQEKRTNHVLNLDK